MVTPDQPQIRNVLATPAGRTDGQWVCQRSASTIYLLLKKRQIPAFKVGADWRFNLASIERWQISLEAINGHNEAPSRSGARRH